MKVRESPPICDSVDMFRAATLSTIVAAAIVVACGLTACAGTTAFQTVPPSATPPASPTPTYLSELPEWARTSGPWLIYPDGFRCSGTEGCPNDYRALIGEPGPILPEGVEYYDPEKHDCVVLHPLGKTCR